MGDDGNNVTVSSFLPQLTGSFSTPAADNPTVQIMEAAYAAGNLDFRYINCDVKPEGLADAIAARWRWDGAASTAPSRTRSR